MRCTAKTAIMSVVLWGAVPALCVWVQTPIGPYSFSSGAGQTYLTKPLRSYTVHRREPS